MMEKQGTVYTLYNECQDCYKCVRRCPVKSIRIQDGHACVLNEKCIACGRCVGPCPSHAKRVRCDLEDVKKLIASKQEVYVSLAPSWRAAFACTSKQMIATLKKLGFKGVSETALGAQEVSMETARVLNQMEKGLVISSACPTIVKYIRLYKPELAPYILPIASPALTHAKLLKKHFGEDIAIVFIGPCIAKKEESDAHKELIDFALTFEELKLWLKDIDQTIVEGNCSEEAFVPEVACEGNLYPIDGGMTETIRQIGISDQVHLLQACSLESFNLAVDSLNVDKLKNPVFIEALACVGGCIHGPCISTEQSDTNNISRIRRHLKKRKIVSKKPKVVVHQEYSPAPVEQKTYSTDEIREALHRIGKYLPEDELNCAGCGYQTCQDMAIALLNGDAEPSMCVSYMRNLAARKANALVKNIPSAMVMLDKNFNIVEANEAFVKMFITETAKTYLENPQKLSGSPISAFFEAEKLFASVLATGQEIHKENYYFNKKYYDLHIFPVEENVTIGVVITDMTNLNRSREMVAKKAKEVIDKNISTVQQIACLLGEHMVQTETILNTIASEYNTEDSP
ncbi:MAG: [Fe-Fe] hydrogenase large subunit C-terminal domain-containing protein [Alphaproteobacteria bacterium]